MAIRTKRYRVLPVIMLIAYLVLCTNASSSNEWQTFKHDDPFALRDLNGWGELSTLDAAPSKYQTRGCKFAVPGAVDPSNAVQPVDQPELEDSSISTASQHMGTLSSVITVGQSGAEVLQKTLDLTGKVINGIPLVGSALSSMLGLVTAILGYMDEDPIAAAMKQLRKEFKEQIDQVRDYVDLAVGSSNSGNINDAIRDFQAQVTDCYDQRRVQPSFLACIRDLEAKYAATATFFPTMRPSIQYSAIFGAATTFAVWYMPIATDFLDALTREEQRLCELDIPSAACRIAYDERKMQITRVVRKVREVARNMREKAVVYALAEAFPLPFTKNGAALENFGHARRVQVIEEYAAKFPNGSAGAEHGTISQMSLHSSDHSDLSVWGEPHELPKSGSITYEDLSVGYHVPRNWNGWKTSTAAYRFSPFVKCDVKSELWTGYAAAGCNSFNAHFYPESCKFVRPRYAPTKSVLVIMQSMVEKYYADGAQWAKTNIIDQGAGAVKLLTDFADALDKPVRGYNDNREQINFDFGLPSGTLLASDVEIRRSRADGINRAHIGVSGMLRIRLTKYYQCRNLKNKYIKISYSAKAGGYVHIHSHQSSGDDAKDVEQCYGKPDLSAKFRLPSSETERVATIALHASDSLAPSSIYAITLLGEMTVQSIDIDVFKVEGAMSVPIPRGQRGPV